jgi:alpha-ketoglutarate-dependent taurine dioxygenase
MAHVKITPLHPSLGASIEGFDLAEPVDEPTRQTLSRALADHLALVFPGQSLTPAQYLAAASLFGPPMEQHDSQHHMPEAPMIGLIWHRNGQRPAEQWHTDHTNRERPNADTRQEDREKYGKPIAHPMVRTHPVHGSRAVYFHISKATHIGGMTPEASRAYMKDLLARMLWRLIVEGDRPR